MRVPEVAWKLAKAVGLIIAVLWAFYITGYLWDLHNEIKLACDYAGDAARNTDHMRGQVSDLPYGCF